MQGESQVIPQWSNFGTVNSACTACAPCRQGHLVERNPSIIERVVTGLIRGYQLAVSPLFPSSCRFYPSCSQYALEAVKIHGTLKGSALSIRRICRCNPWNDGGIDLVPSAKPTNQRPQS